MLSTLLSKASTILLSMIFFYRVNDAQMLQDHFMFSTAARQSCHMYNEFCYQEVLPCLFAHLAPAGS